MKGESHKINLMRILYEPSLKKPKKSGKPYLNPQVLISNLGVCELCPVGQFQPKHMILCEVLLACSFPFIYTDCVSSGRVIMTVNT